MIDYGISHYSYTYLHLLFYNTSLFHIGERQLACKIKFFILIIAIKELFLFFLSIYQSSSTKFYYICILLIEIF